MDSTQLRRDFTSLIIESKIKLVGNAQLEHERNAKLSAPKQHL